MAQVIHGMITVQLPDSLTPPAQAGKLTDEEVNRLPKPIRGVGRLCSQAADAVDRAGTAFGLPPQVTVQSLRDAGARADGIAQCMIDLRVVLRTMRQTNRLFDAEAWKQVRQVNDQIKAQMKHNPGLAVIFQQVLEAFSVFARAAEAAEEEPDEEEDEEEEEVGDGDVVPPTPA